MPKGTNTAAYCFQGLFAIGAIRPTPATRPFASSCPSYSPEPLVSDVRKSLKNPQRAAAGALLQRQSATMSGLLDESGAAYESARQDGLLKGDIGKNTSDKTFMGQDAFRHAYASARATQEFGAEVANVLGRGNEWLAAVTRENDNRGANAGDIGMDLWNNRAGREIAQRLGDDASSEQLRDAVIEAANRGELILSQKDPRALKEYEAQRDMKALGALHDGAAAAVRGAKDTYQAAIEKTADFFTRTDETVRSAASRIEGFKDAIKTAMEKTDGSPMFVFTEKELKQGEAFADRTNPEVLSAVQSTIEFGPQMELSPERHDALMASVHQFSKEQQELNMGRDLQQDEAQVATAERIRDDERAAAAEAEAELDMDA